jgi:hypothetical protein
MIINTYEIFTVAGLVKLHNTDDGRLIISITNHNKELIYKKELSLVDIFDFIIEGISEGMAKQKTQFKGVYIGIERRKEFAKLAHPIY